MSHSFKEANCWADELARLGLAQEDVSLHFASPPPSFVVLLLFADILRMYCSKLCPTLAGDFAL